MVFIDGHVHIWPTYDLKLFFEAAFANFNAVASRFSAHTSSMYVLMAAESPGFEFFSRLTEKLKKQGQTGPRIVNGNTENDQGLVLSHDNYSTPILLVPGKQLVTSESLEVLSFMPGREISSGKTLPETINAILKSGGIAILPWGAGKWLGRRGKIIERFLAESGTRKKGILLGDNGNRPWFWPKSGINKFARLAGTTILPGTDTLDLRHDYHRVGTFGARLDVEADRQDPVGQLKYLLTSENNEMVPYGRPMGTISFVRSQLSLRQRRA